MCCKGKCLETIFTCVLGVIDICGLVSDWLFFCDLKLTEKGLVFGPPEDSAVYALLAFCIIDTLMFFIDVLGHGYSFCTKEPVCINTDAVSLVAVLLADIPQGSISVYIAHCREDGVSYFQYAKAAFVFFGIIVRFIIAVYTYCQDNAHKCLKLALTLLLIVNLALAIAVFVLGNIRRTDINFKSPTEVFDEQFNDQRYFQNVGVFFHHTDFDSSGNQSNWIRVMSVYDVYNHPDTSVSYTYKYEKSATLLKFAVRAKKGGGASVQTEGSPECYQMNLTTGNITNISTNTCWDSIFAQPTSLHINFTYSPPGYIIRRKILGDIQYNIKVRQNNSCMSYNDTAAEASLGYYQVNGTMANFTGPHLVSDSGQPRFYGAHSSDLKDIADVWRTGYGDCQSSGTRAPTMDNNIQLDCSD